MSAPIDGEFNPNHPVTQYARDQWHKIVAILMVHFNQRELEITPAMIAKFAQIEGGSVVMDCRRKKLVIRLVDAEEAEKLAREEGGLPA